MLILGGDILDRSGGGGIDWQEIVKWVLLVLAAGFIGQFGKRLADHLLARRRGRRAVEAGPRAPQRLTNEDQPGDRPDAKIAKKAAKAEVKRAKKNAD